MAAFFLEWQCWTEEAVKLITELLNSKQPPKVSSAGSKMTWEESKDREEEYTEKRAVWKDIAEKLHPVRAEGVRD